MFPFQTATHRSGLPQPACKQAAALVRVHSPPRSSVIVSCVSNWAQSRSLRTTCRPVCLLEEPLIHTFFFLNSRFPQGFYYFFCASMCVRRCVCVCMQSIDRALSPTAGSEVMDEAAERCLNPLTSAGLTESRERIRKQLHAIHPKDSKQRPSLETRPDSATPTLGEERRGGSAG